MRGKGGSVRIAAPPPLFRRPGYPHRVRGDDDPNERDVGPWVDAPFSDDCVRLRSVVVEGLLPATRYRFRYRAQESTPSGQAWAPWRLAALSDWYMTDGGSARFSS